MQNFFQKKSEKLNLIKRFYGQSVKTTISISPIEEEIEKYFKQNIFIDSENKKLVHKIGPFYFLHN